MDVFVDNKVQERILHKEGRSARVVLSEALIDPVALRRDLKSRAKGIGAIVAFEGDVRDLSFSGEHLDALILEHHPTMTIKSLETITSDAMVKFGVDSVSVSHRYGSIFPSETIVYVAVASQHRREAFQAVDYLMDRIKSEAVFWKKEHLATGIYWVEPTIHDKKDLKRWR